MEALMKYLFWVVLGVVLLTAGTVYWLTVPDMQMQTAERQQKCAQSIEKLKTLAAKPEGLATNAKLRAATAYRQDLTTQLDALVRLWEEHAPTPQAMVGGQFAAELKGLRDPARPISLVDFNIWKSDVARQIRDKANSAQLRLPEDFGAKWLFEGLPTRDTREAEQRTQRLAVVDEFVSLLAGVKGEVRTLVFQPDPNQPEGVKTVPVGILSLDGFELLDEKARVERDRNAITDAYRLALASPPRDSTQPNLLTGPSLELRVTMHFELIPKLLIALGKGRAGEPNRSFRYFGIVRKLDFQRLTDPYSKPGDLPVTAPKREGPEDPRAGRVNTRWEEAPVQVLVVLDMLAMQPAALAAKPPAKK